MSIFSQLLHGKITFTAAVGETAAWADHLPGVGQVGTDVIGDLKQAASDAVSFADSIAGTIIGDGAVAIEAGAAVMFAKLGPIGTALTPLADSGIDKAAGILVAAIHAEAARAKAALQASPTPITVGDLLQHPMVAGFVQSQVASQIAAQAQAATATANGNAAQATRPPQP